MDYLENHKDLNKWIWRWTKYPKKPITFSKKFTYRFSVQKLLSWIPNAAQTTHSCACTRSVFIHVHKHSLCSWVDQWVPDKWYLSSFIHWLGIHGVCCIGKNKSIFKGLKNIEQPFFSLSLSLNPALFHFLESCAIFGNPFQSSIPAFSQSQGRFCLSKPRYNGASICGGVTYQWFSFISFVNARGEWPSRKALNEEALHRVRNRKMQRGKQLKR